MIINNTASRWCDRGQTVNTGYIPKKKLVLGNEFCVELHWSEATHM